MRERLSSEKLISIDLSLGIIDRNALTASFVRAVLAAIRPKLEEVMREHALREKRKDNRPRTFDHRKDLLYFWPTADRINKNPLEELTNSLTAARAVLKKFPGWESCRFVLLVDEFTYPYEVMRRGTSTPEEISNLRDFIRQWKALHDTQFLSSFVVGQGTMPFYKKTFPNEFSMMTVKKLSYLSEDETRALVDQPILKRDGTSRYRQYADSALYEYSSGHPFFTQILCDRLVRRANRAKQSNFTPFDVEEAVQSLLVRDDPIDPDRFDCFLSADNTGLLAGEQNTSDVSAARPEEAFLLLYKVAALSAGGQGNVTYGDLAPAGPGDSYLEDASMVTDRHDALVADLIQREVLMQNEDKDSVRIRVPFFAEWLRNQ